MIALALVLAGLCDGPPPAQPWDPDDAASYAEVGDDARAHGELRVAAIAYRNAVARDPGNAHARAALAELCRDDGDARGGIDLAAAIARFRGGELDVAAAMFRVLGSADPGAAHTFLGLIALQQHADRTAEAELALARADPAYADLAGEMSRLAARDGALALTAIVATEIDSNPALLPDTPPDPTTASRATDEDGVIGGSISARPARWLVVRDIASYRVQRSQRQLDFVAETAQAAAEIVRGRWRAGAGYDFDYDVLHASAFLVANRLSASARHDGDRVVTSASYAIHRRDFAQDAQRGFTGFVYSADAGATVHATPRLDVDARLLGWREDTRDPLFSDFAGGAQLTARLRATGRVRATLVGSAWHASYDVSDQDGTLRRDDHVDGDFELDVDLGDNLTAIAAASAAWNGSTVDDFRYTRLVARLAIQFALGVL